MPEAVQFRIMTPARAFSVSVVACFVYAWLHLIAESLFPLVADDLLVDLVVRIRLPWSCMASGVWRTDSSLLLLSEHWIPDGNMLPLCLAGSALLLHSLVYSATAGIYLTWGWPAYLREVMREKGVVRLTLHLWAACAWKAGWVLPVVGLTWMIWLRWHQVELPSRSPVASPLDLRAHAWVGTLGALVLAYAAACGAVLRTFVARYVTSDQYRCWKCGYLLKGLESHRCPECARRIDGRCAGRLRLGRADQPFWMAARWALAATCLILMLALPILGPAAGYVVRNLPPLHRFGPLVPVVIPSRPVGETVCSGASCTLVSSDGIGLVAFATEADGSWTYESTWHPGAAVASRSEIAVGRRGVLLQSRLGQVVHIGPYQLPCTPITKSRAWIRVDQEGLVLRCGSGRDQAGSVRR